MRFRFVLRRMLVTVPMVLVVISLTWALIRLAPGNFYDSERKLPPGVEKNIRAKYGLDDPWYKQYGKVMRNILSLDFGNSLRYETETVNDVLLRTVPVSAAIGTCAYLLALLVGTTLGTIAALKQNSKFDYAAMGLSMLGISMPNFVLGADPRPHLLALALLAAARALGRVPLLEHGAPGADALGHLHGLHRAADAGGDARSPALGLHPHGAREGADRAAGRDAPRLARGAPAGRLVHRPGARHPDYGHGRRRAHLRAARASAPTSSTRT